MNIIENLENKIERLKNELKEINRLKNWLQPIALHNLEIANILEGICENSFSITISYSQEEFMKKILCLSDVFGDYILDHYWLSSETCLFIEYKFPTSAVKVYGAISAPSEKISLYVKSFSNNKCTIQQTTISKIICNI